MSDERSCASCGVPFPSGVSAARLYCDGACRAYAYRARKTAGRTRDVLASLCEAEATGDTSLMRRLTCPECRQPNFAGADRRRDASYCSGRCRTRAWWRRRKARA